LHIARDPTADGEKEQIISAVTAQWNGLLLLPAQVNSLLGQRKRKETNKDQMIAEQRCQSARAAAWRHQHHLASARLLFFGPVRPPVPIPSAWVGLWGWAVGGEGLATFSTFASGATSWRAIVPYGRPTGHAATGLFVLFPPPASCSLFVP
jgi:hypothetical protein